MLYELAIDVMPLSGLLDPQGKTVSQSLNKIGISEIQDARIGKHILLKIEASSEGEALKIAENASKKLLCNAVMESYSISVLNPTS